MFRAAVSLTSLAIIAPAHAQEQRCLDYAKGQKLGALESKRLEETSGMTRSEAQPGVLWLHNDSDDPSLYAIDETGESLGRWDVDGADAVDWEDIALGPCEDGLFECLYLADIGNNDGDRDDQVVYRVREPDVDAPSDATDAVERMQVTFPDGLDVEAMVVDIDGSIYFVSKEADRARLFDAGWFEADTAVEVEELASRKDLRKVTAIDVAPDGARFALRNGEAAWELFRPAGRSVAQAFRATALAIKLAKEKQGEALTYDVEGGGFYTTSEGKSAPVLWYRCKAAGTTLGAKEDGADIVDDPSEPSSSSGCNGGAGAPLTYLVLVLGLRSATARRGG